MLEESPTVMSHDDDTSLELNISLPLHGIFGGPESSGFNSAIESCVCPVRVGAIMHTFCTVRLPKFVLDRCCLNILAIFQFIIPRKHLLLRIQSCGRGTFRIYIPRRI